MRRRALICGSLLTIALASSSAADTPEPDFFFDFRWCHIYGASLGTPATTNDGFVQMKTRGHSTACVRSSKKSLDCITVFEEPGAKSVRYPMKITAEMSQLLVVETNNGSDFLVARSDTGRANVTVRMVGENGLSTKTCHGMWMTGDELKALKSKRPAR